MERDAWMGAGPGAVVCCSATAEPSVAAPAAGGWLGAHTPWWLRETGFLILQVTMFLLMLSIAQVPGDRLELSVFSTFKYSGWGC